MPMLVCVSRDSCIFKRMLKMLRALTNSSTINASSVFASKLNQSMQKCNVADLS
jgi:hypothetical protein